MRTLAILMLMCSLLKINAQTDKQASIWYFGEEAGLDFNTGSPYYLLNGAMNKDEGCSSISDVNGNLLFYTSGLKVWNRNHIQMPNGSGLAGHESSSQSALIVPKPGTNHLFYIFTTDAFFYANGLRYSVVDMTLQGGLGDVTQKNILLHTPSTEKITAVKHSNGTDIWVVTHPGNSDQFYAYPVTSAGVGTPVISTAGIDHSAGGVGGTQNAIGCMKLSPDGTKLALAIYNAGMVELFSFNATTGVISNTISFPGVYLSVYGIEFSPDCSKLYFTSDSLLYQADLTSGNPQAIIASVIPVGSIPLGPFGSGYLGALQLGPDGKIYGTSFFSEYLFVVNIPNALGIECDFIPNGVYLGGRHCYAGLPGFVQTIFASAPQNLSNYPEPENQIVVFPNPSSGIFSLKIPEPVISISVLDETGREVLTFKDPDESLLTMQICEGGIYIIKAQSKNRMSLQKLIVAH